MTQIVSGSVSSTCMQYMKQDSVLIMENCRIHHSVDHLSLFELMAYRLNFSPPTRPP
jgi:hypothetical protein